MLNIDCHDNHNANVTCYTHMSSLCHRRDGITPSCGSWDIDRWHDGVTRIYYVWSLCSYAAVNGHLELTLLKGRQRFDVVSASNLEVYKFQDWWIFTYFIFGPDESSPNNIWSKVNLERTCVLLFYYFLYFKVNLDLEKNKSAWWIFTQLYFCGGETWPNYFGKEVNWWWILT